MRLSTIRDLKKQSRCADIIIGKGESRVHALFQYGGKRKPAVAELQIGAEPFFKSPLVAGKQPNRRDCLQGVKKRCVVCAGGRNDQNCVFIPIGAAKLDNFVEQVLGRLGAGLQHRENC